MAFVAVFSFSGSELIRVVFGDAYIASTELAVLLALHYGLRIMRVPTTVICLVNGSTKRIATANLLRATGVLFSWLVAIQTSSIPLVFCVAVLAEAIAVLYLFFAGRRHQAIMWNLMGITGISFAAVTYISLNGYLRDYVSGNDIAMIALSCAIGGGLFFVHLVVSTYTYSLLSRKALATLFSLLSWK